MEMEFLSKELVKPSSPTPSHLRMYPLSFIDNIVFHKYVPVIFFYNPNQNTDQNSKISQLRKSLSHTLSKYYHFAGRLNDKTIIECNDLGVSFLVAKTKNKLSCILQNPTEILLNPLFPDELQWKDMDWSASLIFIQINCFACGGIAISICMSHKIGDASTLFNFMNDWAIINQKVEQDERLGLGLSVLPSPLLDGGASVFPQRDIPIFPEIEFVKDNKVVSKRFLFEASKINSLKEMVRNSVGFSLTRVQVVTALIYKRAVLTSGLNFKTASFNMVVDLRKRMVPPLSDKRIGNFAWFFGLSIDKEKMELQDLVFKIKEGLSEFCDVILENFGGKEKHKFSLIYERSKNLNETAHTEDNDLFLFSSWCRFGMYKVNFGWGKPAWVTTFCCSMRNIIFLMETKDGNGIEAIVNLEEKNMAKFENDVELLQYASLNPSIV
ncbi:stemmadenine O-acetyltransferase-like [Vicia villosa]|uniref:stemmadenine O-acetyltransferase-like n=1 Tax=Vicia villosa TaxID=3911 RepID=UPI00273B52C6|nr:stemmadenine O-acetyltransferase-like [Vicia villosa]